MSIYDPAVSDGVALSRQQIANHGKDRYPTPKLNAEKLVVEAAELLGAISEHENGRCLAAPVHEAAACPRVRHELADTGLALHALVDKLGIDLTMVMIDLVEHDHRRFT